jgi:glycosyltransferase involved in cell wall biosynthesis
MREIKVYLRLGSHVLYNDLTKFPPEGIQYTIPKASTTAGQSKILGRIKVFFWNQYTKITPPAFLLNPGNADLIHSTAGKLILNNTPWIVDVESIGNFVQFRYNMLKSENYTKKILGLLTSKYCKKILPHCIAGQKSITTFFKSEAIENKMEVVYPARSASKIDRTKKRKNEKIEILFVGKTFYEKGGKEVLDVFEALKTKYDLNLTMISNAPQEIFNRYKNIPGIRIFHPKFRYDDLMNFFLNADIFLYPTYMDTFGIVFLEAMNYRLPIVTTKIFAVPELVDNGKSGFLIDSPISWHDSSYQFMWKNWNDFVSNIKRVKKEQFVVKLAKATSLLIEDSSLRNKMGKHGREQIEKGKFSIKERNLKLRRIYEEALAPK